MINTLSKKYLQLVLRNKKAFIFDWDGTLFDSMEAKKESFAKVLTSYFAAIGNIESADIARDLYSSLSGRPRNEILQNFAQAQNFFLDKKKLSELNTLLFYENRNNLEMCILFPDALRLLNLMVEKNIEVYISSSVPQEELIYFVKQVLPETTFFHISQVLGSSDQANKGVGHLNLICNTRGFNYDDLIVFGDDEADYDLSKKAGVDCIVVDRGRSRFNDGLFPVIESLDEICGVIK